MRAMCSTATSNWKTTTRINVADAAARHTAQREFKEFIWSFGDVKEPFPYRVSLLQNSNILQVALEDLQNFDDELCESLRTMPADYLPQFEVAAAEVLVRLKYKVPGEDGNLVEPSTGDVQVLLTSKEKASSIRGLAVSVSPSEAIANNISRLVKIMGIIIAASRTKAKAASVTLICKYCTNIKTVACRPGLGGAVMPRSCGHATQPGEEPCPLDPFVVVPDKSKYVDQQTLKLQENPEDVPTGELPRNLLLAVDHNMV